MKAFIKLFMVAVFVLLSVESQATSWRVCSRAEARANFTSCSAAVASLQVFAGDTLYVEPGHVELSSLTINKALIIIGPGFFLNSNNINAMDSREAVFNAEVNLTAAGTNIYGCVFRGQCHIKSNTHVIERCEIEQLFYVTDGGNRSDITIRNCFFKQTDCYTQYQLMTSIIENNIFNHCRMTHGSYNGYVECVIRNNTILCCSDAPLITSAVHSEIYNNIIINCHSGFSTTTTNNQTIDTSWYRDRVINASSGAGNDVHHNILSCQPNADFRNCVFDASLSQILIWDNATTLEEKFKHIANGTAVGAGTNGTTIGAYGAVNGSTPYRPAGIPQYRPYIYDANIDQTPSSNNTINASFKIKVQND